jgi:hypothetical protein
MVKKKGFARKNRQIIVILGIAVILILVVLLFLRGNEDSWIKEGNGLWIKHGNPSSIPENIEMQENALKCAHELYVDIESSGLKVNSQCLGTCFGYAVDIVHVPRIAEDDKNESQCLDYVTGSVDRFIEIDKNGEVVRVVGPNLK